MAIRKLWFDQTIKEAVDAPRIHHQIFPMRVEYEFGVPEVRSISDDVMSNLFVLDRGLSVLPLKST